MEHEKGLTQAKRSFLPMDLPHIMKKEVLAFLPPRIQSSKLSLLSNHASDWYVPGPRKGLSMQCGGDTFLDKIENLSKGN